MTYSLVGRCARIGMFGAAAHWLQLQTMGTGNGWFTVFSGLGVIGLASLIALDPDIPAPFQRIRFKLIGDMGSYDLYLNDNLIGSVSKKEYDWKPEHGISAFFEGWLRQDH